MVLLYDKQALWAPLLCCRAAEIDIKEPVQEALCNFSCQERGQHHTIYHGGFIYKVRTFTAVFEQGRSIDGLGIEIVGCAALGNAPFTCREQDHGLSMIFEAAETFEAAEK